MGSHLFELLLKTPVLLCPKVAWTVALTPWCRLRELELDEVLFHDYLRGRAKWREAWMMGGEEVGGRLEQTLSHLSQQVASPPTAHLRGGARQHDVAPEKVLLLAQSLQSRQSRQTGQWREVEGMALGQPEVTGNVLLLARVTILELRMHQTVLGM